MRRVDADGDSQGVREYKREVARPGMASRPRLRRASLESLERRELLSTLPVPQVLTTATTVSVGKSGTANANSPSVAVDPVNPQKLVAAWVVNDSQPINGQVTSYVQGAYSVDGGQTWLRLGLPNGLNQQRDFTKDQSNGEVDFTKTADATVAFGRDESAYLLTSTTSDGSAGVIDLQRFDFTVATSAIAPSQTLTNKQVYTWAGGDSAATPTLAVDNNLPAFTDVNSAGQATTQLDPFAGNVYVAWASTDNNRGGNAAIQNFNPNTIRMVASSDRGANFTHASFVDDTSNSNEGAGHAGKARYVEPSIAISQGTASTDGNPAVPGGQVTVVYDDWRTGFDAGIPFDRIVSQVDLVGGTDAHFAAAGTPDILIPPKAVTGPDIAVDTNVPINVSITDPNFTTLQALDVTLKLAFPNLNKVRAVLQPPAGLLLNNGTPAPSILLFNNGVDGNGTAVNAGQGLAGTNLGNTTGSGFGTGSGTVFDGEAVRSIVDSAPTGRYLGHYRAVGNASLLAYKGLTGAQLSGQWTLVLTVFQNETGTTGSSVQSAALDFTSGNNPGANADGSARPEVVVADNTTFMGAFSANINPAVAGTTTSRRNTTGVSADPGRVTSSNVQAPRILPTPVVASDNTLGAYSPHQGRIYVAYTGRYDGINGIAKDQTDIFLLASDDGGLTWEALASGLNDGIQVNDDNSLIDGYSESLPGTATGRPQLQPQVAVDQSTGSVVVSFLDTRNDASRARVATYIAVSNDGGASFAPQTYANPTNTATDAITGNTVNLGPVPDNQSAGSNQDPFGFGQHQGLAVANGKIIPVWSSNLNRGFKGDTSGASKLAIRSAILTDAGGPRVISGTMGPVGQPGDSVNATRSTLDGRSANGTGTPVANTIDLTFDRPVDPNTFNADVKADGSAAPIGTGDVRVFYQDPYAPATASDNTPLVNGFFSTPALTKVLTLSGHAGVPVVDGQVSVRLSGFTDLGQVTITLKAPNGRTMAIPTIPGTTALDTTVRLPASMLGGAVDGAYVLSVSSTPGQVGTFLGWSLQLNGVPTSLRVLSVTPLDAGAFGATRFRVVFDPTDPATGVPTGVGTYSYIVRPNLSDRIRYAPAVTLTPTSQTVNGAARPTFSNSSATVSATGQSTQLLTSIKVSATFTSANPLGRIRVRLTTGSGQSFTLASLNLATQNTFTLSNVALPLPPNATLLANDSYTLSLVSPDNPNISLDSGNSIGWSVTLTGSTSAANFATAPTAISATSANVPVTATGTATATSTVTLSGHNGQVIAGGTVQLSLTSNNLAGLTLTLVGPGGQQFVLPTQAGASLTNASFALPSGFLGQPVDGPTGFGQYRLRITGSRATDTATLTAWSLAFQGVPTLNYGTTTVTENAVGSQVPLPLIGTTAATSSIFLAGHPGLTVAGGSVRLSIADTNLADLTITLIAPNSQQFVLPQQFGTSLNNISLALPANFLGQAVDGQYQLRITDANGADRGTLTAWSLQILAAGFNGTLMDQNGDGTTGQDFETTPFTGLTPGDDFVAPMPAPTGPTTFSGPGLPAGPYANGSLPLIVAGPHVQDTVVTGVKGVTDSSIKAVNASATGLPLSLVTTSFVTTSSLAISGHPNESIVDGTITVDLTRVSSANPTTIQLTGPGGQTFLLPQVFASGVTTARLPDSFFKALVNGTYQLSILDLDQAPGDTLNAWSLSLRTTSEVLILNDTVSSVNVVFDRQVQVSSVTNQVLNVVGPAGSISGPQVFSPTATDRYSVTPPGAAAPTRVEKSYDSTNVGLAIPTGGGFLVSNLPIFAPGVTVSSVRVTVNIADPNVSTLALTLIAPDGTRVPLVAAGAASGANFSNTTFSDTPGANGLTVGIGAGRAPYGLTYQPSGPAGALAALAGHLLDGTWKLEIIDSSPAGTPSAGRLNAWSLAVTPQVRDGGVLDSTLTVPNSSGTFLIDNLAVRLDITAAKASDFSAYLVAPDGTVVSLFADPGGVGSPGANFSNTTFDSRASLSIQKQTSDPAGLAYGVAPYTLTYRPYDQPGFATLASLRGKVLDGTWTLRIKDNFTNGVVATLNSWSLIATPRVTVTAVDPVTTASGVAVATTFKVSFPVQQLSGTYAVTLGSGVVGVDPTVANPAAPAPVAGAPILGFGADANLNAGVDVLKGTSTTGNLPTVPVSYPATGVPVAIPGSGNSVTSTLTVPDNFLIQPITLDASGRRVSGITLQINITYPTDQDLQAYLLAPDGTRVNLFTNVGTGTSDFSNTVFDDTAAASIRNAGNHFFGTFTPESALENLAGSAAGGTWKLVITNTGSTANTGTLMSWSLSFRKPVPASGLGDPVSDRQTLNFRIFNIDPSNPLANDTWTAVGPAGVTVNPPTQSGLGTLAGPVSSVAYDPSDPSRNTVYVAAASGGIWKTNNFLTTNPSGPTYVPLTDFGPNFSLDVGSIAIFGRSSDPDQSIVFAGTGFAQGTYPYGGASAGYPNLDGSAGRGVGFLRSFDGGKSWTLLDSTVNVDPAGNPLPINSPLRDHRFVGTTTYKVLVDPTPLPNGQTIVYAALGGPNGGLYQSLDTGATWALLRAGQATDIILDPNSRSASTGNIDIVYAAFQGEGVFSSSNRGQSLTLMTGMLGIDPLIKGPGFPAQSAIVGNAGVTPNGAKGRIVLAKPALTGNALVDLLYQDWLYAAVETADGRFDGLYITKDRGQNWTKAQLLNLPFPLQSTSNALPTNNNGLGTTYDPTANDPGKNFAHNGNYAMTLSIDPSNPNIVYLGGSQDFQDSGLIRVDLTAIRDAHDLVSFANDRNDGGTLLQNSSGGINVSNPTTVNTSGVIYNPPFYPTNPPTPYLNFRHAPNANVPGTNPFDLNGTLVIQGRASQTAAGAVDFNNDGTGVKWSLLDEPLKANAGDATGSTNLHYSTAFIDPLTGNVRLIFADDQGVFTAVLNPDGTLDDGIGTAAAVNYSRNGNLQDQQLYYGAAQVSNLAAQAAGALFYASGHGVLAAQSDPNILSNGNLTWDNSNVLSPPAFGSRDTSANTAISSSDRAGVGIATDQTGGSTAVFEYDVPSLGGNLSDFFRVSQVGRTTGLDNNISAEFPFGNLQSSGTSGQDAGGAVANGQIPLGNFTVNPLNASQILIGSAQGILYQTVNQGAQFLPIGTQANFDGTQLTALAYGAPDPQAPGGIGNLNNFIYVGTIGRVGGAGHIYVTQTGGQGWRDISAGLDGGSVVAIYPSPDRGSHAAYAVTLDGVFYNPDTITRPWSNITGNLAQIQHSPFGDATLGESALATFNSNTGAADQGTAAYGGFRSIVADYRYAVPDPADPTKTYPVLYVAGYGGVFRTLDNGQTWTAFPNTAFDAAPVDGGYLPNVQVTNLQLNLGAVNPATGRPSQVLGDPAVLLATTFGRGAFAIRLAPDVFPSTVGLDPTMPAASGNTRAGSDSGPIANDRVTNVARPFITGYSEISNFGNVVTITLTDLDAPGTPVIGTGTTDTNGRFSIQLSTPFATDGIKHIGIQAKDLSGSTGNVTTFVYTFKATRPAMPGTPVLEAASDSGRSNSDTLTNVANPTIDIATQEPATSVINLYRLDPNNADPNSVNGRVLVGSAQGGISPVKITDNELAAFLGGNKVYTNLQYVAEQVDLAGNVSPASGVLTISLKNTLPPALAAPTLQLGSNSGLVKSQLITNNRNPFFDVSALESSQSQVFLFRSIGGSTPINVGFAAVGSTVVRDIVGATTDGTYLYQVVQVDIFGNFSPLGQGVAVTINTQAPPAPSLTVFPADDTGAPSRPDVTRVRNPRFQGTGTPGLQIVVYATFGSSHANDVPVAETTVSPDGTYLANSFGNLDDNTYTFVARTINAAGNISYSPPLVLTIKGNGPQVVPTLSILAADDTGVKGDSVTANHRPRFTGRTDKGVSVTLYSLVNGVLSAPQATATSSTLDGSFTFQLPFNLFDGSTQLVAQATDVAGNRGPLSPALAVRIVTVAGDYANAGRAQFAVFRPSNETYIVRNGPTLAVDATPGRDIPVQADFNGDGLVDLVAYRFNAAQYNGFLSDGSVYTQQFGQGGNSLPVSGYYDGSGTLLQGLFNPDTGIWAINTPVPGGRVVTFGAPDSTGARMIPTPAAFDGNGVTEISFFRPQDDTFYVLSPGSSANYAVSFTDPAVVAKGFTYKAGDIPAPADYDGIGRDEFAVYRPSTGQFFILRVPNLFDKASWTLRTVSLNIPGGPKVGDVPASQDYEGTGKASPTVYRPSNSTFYEIQTTNGVQQNIQFGQPGLDVAAAGPLLYRLSALTGSFASTDGYPAVVTTTGGGSYSAGGSVTAKALSLDASPSSGGTPGTLAAASTLALATPAPVVAPAPVASAPPVALAFASTAPSAVPAASAPISLGRVIVGNTTPKAAFSGHAAPKASASHVQVKKAAAKAKAAPHAPQPAKKALTVHTTATPAKAKATPDQHHAAVAAALKTLAPVKLKAGRHDD